MYCYAAAAAAGAPSAAGAAADAGAGATAGAASAPPPFVYVPGHSPRRIPSAAGWVRLLYDPKAVRALGGGSGAAAGPHTSGRLVAMDVLRTPAVAEALLVEHERKRYADARTRLEAAPLVAEPLQGGWLAALAQCCLRCCRCVTCNTSAQRL